MILLVEASNAKMGGVRLVCLLLPLFAFSFADQVAPNFQRENALVYANFQKHNSKRLVPPSGTTNLSTKKRSPTDCSFECLKHTWCRSYNFQKAADKEGRHICEVLSADKYNNSEDFRSSEEFDHFSIVVSTSSNSRHILKFI